MKEAQKSPEFNPTPEQVEFAESYIIHFGNISKICEELKIDRGVFYKNWRKQEGFDLWLSEYAKNEVLKKRGKWYLIAEKFAASGSFKHLEMLMQIAKEFAPSPTTEIKQTFVYLNEKAKKENVGNRITSELPAK